MAPIMSESFQRSANTRLPFAFRLSCCWVFRRWFRLGLFFMLYQWSPGGNLLFIRPLHLALSAHSIHDSRHPWTIFAIVHEAPYEFVFLRWHDPLVAFFKSFCTFQQKHTSCSCSLSARIGGSTALPFGSRDSTISYVT